MSITTVEQSALKHHVEQWLANHDFSETDVDCAVTVMLKIIDGKCKMPPGESAIMAALYDAVCRKTHNLLDKDVHTLIQTSRNTQDESVKLAVYEQRLLAETIISRPVMKAFKAYIRQNGLLQLE